MSSPIQKLFEPEEVPEPAPFILVDPREYRLLLKGLGEIISELNKLGKGIVGGITPEYLEHRVCGSGRSEMDYRLLHNIKVDYK